MMMMMVIMALVIVIIIVTVMVTVITTTITTNDNNNRNGNGNSNDNYNNNGNDNRNTSNNDNTNNNSISNDNSITMITKRINSKSCFSRRRKLDRCLLRVPFPPTFIACCLPAGIKGWWRWISVMDCGVGGSGMTVVRPPSSFRVRWIGHIQHGSLNGLKVWRSFQAVVVVVAVDVLVWDVFGVMRATVDLHMACLTKGMRNIARGHTRQCMHTGSVSLTS